MKQSRHLSYFRPVWRLRGFSIVEVLVSVVVLTIGMLGMLGLQAATLQANRDARLQSLAALQARELADMMRGNNAVSENTTASNPYVGSFASPLRPKVPNACLNVGQNASAGCATTTDVAQAQMTEWLARVDTELPGARVEICRDSAPFDATGLARWSCTAGVGAPLVIKIGWTRSATNRSLQGSAALERALVPSLVVTV
jgi:type IV pilus assembly protein PilV